MVKALAKMGDLDSLKEEQVVLQEGVEHPRISP
jgi:hypothetical protein